jgi:uncharacterized protein (TIGR00369 family)
MLQLPHTAGCIACGPANPHGLHLALFVDPAGTVHTEYTPRPEHIGFQGVLHGGVLATVVDEAMVWCATWSGKRFCLCGELCVRYRAPAAIGQPLSVVARVESGRPRLILTTAEVRDAAGTLVAEATGKYVPLPPQRNREFVATLLDNPEAAPAIQQLRQAAETA